MDIFDFSKLQNMALAPPESGGFNEWCEQADVVPFLNSEASDEDVLVYASLDHVFIHTVLVPQHVTIQDHGDDLNKWSFNPYSSWSLVASQHDVWIEKPCQSAGCETLKEATQIIFGRSFEGLNDGASYYEINQKITHLLGLHFVPERHAWCKLDRHGDIKEIIKVITVPVEGATYSGVAVTFDSSELQKYCATSRMKLLRMFDFTRYKKGAFPGWGKGRQEMPLPHTEGISISLTIERGVGSYSRGIQIIEPTFSPDVVRDELWGTPDEEKHYASFIAQDWKNNRIAEISCSPNALSNYFTKSDLPFEITPAFFRTEILSKYKADRQKYELQERSISCRGAWHLETYDINKAGQVHTYLVYLSRLPYEE